MFKIQINADEFIEKYNNNGKSAPKTSRMTQTVVLGDLDISNRNVFLPDNLKIYGNLKMHRSWTLRIGDNTEITGNCDIRYTRIKSLPKQFIVHGDLTLIGTDVSIWPKDAIIEGNIHINDAKLTGLPENFFAFHDLKLTKLDIRTLPSGMIVNGNLDVKGIPLDSWPDDIVVRGNIEASRQLMELLPVKQESVIPITPAKPIRERKQEPPESRSMDDNLGDIIFI